jgi:SAM-dependent methyltransferase
MSDTTTGIRRLLSWPRAYELLQVAVGSNSSHRRFVAEYVRAVAGTRLLDIGCGPGHILRALPAGVGYVGVDLSSEYIASARREWGDRGEFVCTPVSEAHFDRQFDVVMAMGLLHHLDDAECDELFGFTRRVLAPNGRFVAVDPAYAPGQGRIARWLIGRDRGAHVRGADAYAELARASFGSVRVSTRDDLLRVPYTHAVLEAGG